MYNNIGIFVSAPKGDKTVFTMTENQKNTTSVLPTELIILFILIFYFTLSRARLALSKYSEIRARNVCIVRALTFLREPVDATAAADVSRPHWKKTKTKMSLIKFRFSENSSIVSLVTHT